MIGRRAQKPFRYEMGSVGTPGTGTPDLARFPFPPSPLWGLGNGNGQGAGFPFRSPDPRSERKPGAGTVVPLGQDPVPIREVLPRVLREMGVSDQILAETLGVYPEELTP